MTQPVLTGLFVDPVARPRGHETPVGRETANSDSLCDRLARYFQARPNVWIDAHAFFDLAGSMGWRTRISELRHAPWHLRIENRVRVFTRADKSRFTVSEYRLVTE